MKIFFKSAIYLAIAASAFSSGAFAEIGEKQSFNEGWLFDKYEGEFGTTPKFNDKKWRKLDLPHD